MPSPSTSSVSVRLASSSSRCRSADERASRETSRPKIAPTSPQTHPRHQLPEPVAALGRAARHAQIGVDHLHLGSAGQPSATGLLGQRVLAGGRLGVLAHLRQRRLAHVDHRQPLQVRA